ncbi:hypothetical protein [Pectobacterium versatile]|uniref:hypothetical protein n=1 Tax=Pectobacterium versatile TaxID=2488639 RepID=UPI0038700ED4
MDIYVDYNVYLNILNREDDYEWVAAKLNNLRKSTSSLIYSPAHIEEIAENRSRDNVNILKVMNKTMHIISRYTHNVEYLPGGMTTDEINNLLSQLSDNPAATPTCLILKEVLRQNLKFGTTDDYYQTQRVIESPRDCMERVYGLIDQTDVAHENDIYHMGRRNDNSLLDNFSLLGIENDNIQTFESYQKEKNLGPKRLSNIAPQNIFNDQYVIKEFIIKLRNSGFIKTPTKEQLYNSHQLRSDIITLTLNFLEKIGYRQERKNSSDVIRSRMHDVSHAIYGSSANYFVTFDKRLRDKLIATYYFLKIPCQVMDKNEFISHNFSHPDVINI